MGLVNQIKKNVQKSGSNKAKILYFKADSKVRVRFLQDANDGLAITFHDSFELGINVPCQEVYGRSCDYCEDEDLRHRELYAWSVYDYDNNEVKILLAAASQFTPIPSLIGMYEGYRTLLDRDYVITRIGAQLNTSYTVVPMDKATFKNKKVKAYTHKEILEIIDKAFPTEQSDEKGKSKDKGDIKDIEDEDWEEEGEEEQDYEEMSAQELYKLCKERNIDVKPKQKKAHYIQLLEAFDNVDDEDEEEEEEDEW